MQKKILQNYNFDEHFYAVLMTSRLPDYQLAWSLNQYLKVDFRKLPDLSVNYPKKGKDLHYTFYGWSSPNAIDYFLVTSPEKSATLSEETLLLIEQRERQETVKYFIEKIAASDFIFFIEEISFDKPKTSKQKQLVEQLNNIAIDMEEYLDKLKEKPKYYLQKKNNKIPL